MMRPTDRHVQNRIQNVLIVCLVLSALFLLSRTELIRAGYVQPSFHQQRLQHRKH